MPDVRYCLIRPRQAVCLYVKNITATEVTLLLIADNQTDTNEIKYSKIYFTTSVRSKTRKKAHSCALKTLIYYLSDVIKACAFLFRIFFLITSDHYIIFLYLYGGLVKQKY
jgi:hypothetical protein